MIHRGLLVEIEGVASALVNSNQLTPTAYQGIQEVIVALSPSLSQQVSQDTAQSTLSGATLQVSDFSWAMEASRLSRRPRSPLTCHRRRPPSTSTTRASSIRAAWCGLGRRRFATPGRRRPPSKVAFGDITGPAQPSTAPPRQSTTGNPFVLGRQVWFYWQDYSNQTKNTLRWSGFLEAVEWDDVTTLTCVSPQKLLTDSQVCATTFGKGTLKEEIGPSESWRCLSSSLRRTIASHPTQRTKTKTLRPHRLGVSANQERLSR